MMMTSLKGYRHAPPATRFSATLLACAVLGGAFWFLDRQHDRGPLGLHDSVALGLIFLFVICVAFPNRLHALGELLSKTKLGKGGDAGGKDA